MPIYEYTCSACGNTFELLQKLGEPATCQSPCCDALSQRCLSVPATYSNAMPRPAGRTCCGREERCDTPPCGDGKSCCHG